MSDKNQGFDHTTENTAWDGAAAEQKKESPAGKLELLKRLSSGESEFYVMMSACTKSPYVVCDPETFDDEVLLLFTEEEARKEHGRLTEAKVPDILPSRRNVRSTPSLSAVR